MTIVNTMRPIEVFSGKSGDVFMSLNGKRYHLMHLTEIEATVEYEKGDVPMLGKRMTGHKINGMNGAYKDGGGAPVYDIEITNVEEGTGAGTQRVVLIDCMPDSEVLAKVDAGSEFLEEDIEGTFDDFSIDETFSSDMPGYIES